MEHYKKGLLNTLFHQTMENRMFLLSRIIITKTIWDIRQCFSMYKLYLSLLPLKITSYNELSGLI